MVKETHDVIIQNIRSRLGNQYPGCNLTDHVSKDAGWIYKSQNVIIDHCSFSWGTDEVFSVTGDYTDNITVQWSIISEALHCSCHEKGCHGFGLIMGGILNKNRQMVTRVSLIATTSLPIIRGEIPNLPQSKMGMWKFVII